MSRTVHGIEPTPAAILAPRIAHQLPTISRFPWLTVATGGMVLGLALLIGSRPSAAPPLALASPPPAQAAAVAEQVRQLADRVAQLEAEVAELRSPRVARTSLED